MSITTANGSRDRPALPVRDPKLPLSDRDRAPRSPTGTKPAAPRPIQSPPPPDRDQAGRSLTGTLSPAATLHPPMSARRAVTRVFHPRWLLVGIALGLGLQVLAWLTGFGLLGGLPSYLVMGVVVGKASPGNTILEPGVAAFVVASLGFVLDHLLLSVVGVGLVIAAGYGLVGMALGLAGGWIGEQL